MTPNEIEFVGQGVIVIAAILGYGVLELVRRHWDLW